MTEVKAERLCIVCKEPGLFRKQVAHPGCQQFVDPPPAEQKRAVESVEDDAVPAPEEVEYDAEFQLELHEAKTFARKKVMRDYYVSQFKQGEDIEGLRPAARQWFEQMLAKQNAKEDNKKTGHRWFITVNPKEGVELQTLHTAVRKAVKKKYVDKEHTFWCYEVTDNPQRAPHAHMLVFLNESKAYSTIKKEFGNTFKNLVDNDKAVRYDPCFTETAKDNMTRYIQGTKRKPASNAKHIQHCLPWRKRNNVKPIYDWKQEAL